ncbi:MAG: ComEC family competence protein [Candidatus Bipolaricaulota bacterium]|nr:ComEC family competence protein [Candidatus Bipolaricaulota bacterium]MCS7273816.1 ComEC family competence protein [Candidatus Bipolaricaulota bacterium]MDW8110766.1 ComEC/Rec2 family competence protein [Candidatus Bipolaricaulota bacterium]MDW8328376.1 ComEC/Rec2 family competence protein [Candidatus Bipolaricaulota bacterium]
MRRRRPIVWAAIALALGILVGRLSEGVLSWPLWGAVALPAAIGWSVCVWRAQTKRAAFLLVLVLVSGGAALYLNARFPVEQFYRYADRYWPVRGIVISYPDRGPERTRFVLQLSDAPGRLQVFYEHRSQDKPLKISYGDEVLVRAAPRAPRNFSGFDYRDYLRRREIWGVVRVWRSSEIEILSHRQGNKLLQWGYDLREDLFRRLEQLLSPEHSGLLKALLFGERESLSREIERGFREAGVAHVLVASGANLAMILGLLALSLWGFSLARLYLFATPFVFMYLLIVGFEPSLVRATLMFYFLALGYVCAERGWILRRWADPLQSLAAAAFVILLYDPEALFEASFQLSFAGTLGIVISVLYAWPWLQPRLGLTPSLRAEPAWKKIARSVTLFVLVSLGAQGFVAPVLFSHFQRVYLWEALLGNLVIVPLVAVALWGGVALLGLSFVSISLAQAVAPVEGACLKLLMLLSEFFAGL